MKKLRVVIAGAGGKMGQTLIEAVQADKSLQLAGALDAKGSPALGRNLGGLKVVSDIGKAMAGTGGCYSTWIIMSAASATTSTRACFVSAASTI